MAIVDGVKRGSSKTKPLALAGVVLIAVALEQYFMLGNRGALPYAAGVVGTLALAQAAYFWWKYRA